MEKDRRTKLLARLKRVEGQIRGLTAMIERGDDCEKVAQQMAAARKALDKSFYQMIACVMEQELSAPDVSTETIEHINQLLTRYG